MRPSFLESDGSFRLQSDPRHLNSNLTLKVMTTMVVGSLTLEFDPRNRMRPLFFESDGNYRPQSDPRNLTSNLTLKVMTHNCRWLAHARV